MVAGVSKRDFLRVIVSPTLPYPIPPGTASVIGREPDLQEAPADQHQGDKLLVGLDPVFNGQVGPDLVLSLLGLSCPLHPRLARPLSSACRTPSRTIFI